MWPFKCKQCDIHNDNLKYSLSTISNLREQYRQVIEQAGVEWHPFDKPLPIKTNILVANKDFTYFGFLYFEDGMDYRKINMQGKDKIWATYTNPESIAWWLNLDLIKNA